MSEMERLLLLVKEANSRTARIQALTAKMTTMPEHSFDNHDVNFLSVYLKTAIDDLRTVQEMVSYLSRPIKETSRLWKNGSGQYETTAGFLYQDGSPIEVLVPDKYGLGSSRWERTVLRFDGRDYYLDNDTNLPLAGLAVRVREGD